MKKIDSVFEEALTRVKPAKEEIQEIDKLLKDFLKKIRNRIKKLKVRAEIFVGGSYSKNTLIKKDYYDIDIFLRFDKKHKDHISNLSKKIISHFNNCERIHGSRDYYRIKARNNIFFEVVPVLKINDPKEAENITDLSYSHVKYINKKIKSNKILDDIRIAKAFCHANNCYGAESYVQGFSGYALELLIYHYGGFVNFLKAVEKPVKDKVIIDIEKQYRKKEEILMNINEAKLHSPIILIDPTYKQRNALAALSQETFDKFRENAKQFLKNPSIKLFEQKKTNLDKIRSNALKNKNDFILLEASTDKQAGDIAGSKLLKFYRHFNEEISRFFEIKNKGFNYDKRKTARYFFVVKSKGVIILNGPDAKDKDNLLKFQKRHKNIFIKNGKVFAREKINFTLKFFIENWKKENTQKLEDMHITKLSIIR
jgi:tRNA CCA-adding enzyme